MGARASRRRHEGRRIRKARRQLGVLGAGFTALSEAAERAAKQFMAFGATLSTSLASTATARRPDGSAIAAVDTGAGSPSQTGVEAGREAHSVAEKVDATAARMGLELAPWQRELAIASLSGTPLIHVGGRRSGRATVEAVASEVRGPDSDLAWVDEFPCDCGITHGLL